MNRHQLRPLFVSVLLGLVAALPASAQDSPAPAAPQAATTTSPLTALELAQEALEAASVYNARVSTLTVEVQALQAGVSALTTATRPTFEALTLARREFAGERVRLAGQLAHELQELPDTSGAVAFLEAREAFAERLDRRRREAQVAEGKAALLVTQPSMRPQAALARERARFLGNLVRVLEQAGAELEARWEEAYPDEAERMAAEAEGLRQLAEAKHREREGAAQRAQAEALALEARRQESEKLAERARRDLERASTEDDQRLAEIRLAHAEMQRETEEFRVKALQAEAEAHAAEEELGATRAELTERVPLLLAGKSPPRKVAEYRARLAKQAAELREGSRLLQEEVKLQREKVPTFRADYQRHTELYDRLEEGMEARGKEKAYRSQVYFARLAQRQASERLDEMRTVIEWRERTLLSWLRRAEALEAAGRELEPASELRTLGQTRDQWKRFGTWLLLTLLVAVLVDFLARTLFKAFSDRTSWTWDDIALEELSLPVKSLVFLGGLGLSIDILTLEGTGAALARSWGDALRAAWIGFLAWRMLNIFSRVLEPTILATEAKLDDQLFRFLRKGLRIVVVAGSAVFILEGFGWKVTSLLAGLGIGGLAFALAAQDTLANLFGSIVLFLDRPFKVGNWVVINGVEGIVEDIGIRSTRIRTFKDTLVTIPNADVAKSSSENIHSFRKRRLYFTIELRFDTKVDTIRKAVEEIRRILTEHPMVMDGFYVYVTGIKASGVEIMVYSFVATRDWGEWMLHCQDIYLTVLAMLEEIGAGLAFPTQTIEFEHVKGLPPSPPPAGAHG